MTTAPPTADQAEGPDPVAGTGQLTSESSVETRATGGADKAAGRWTGWTSRRVDIAVCVALTLAAVVLDHGLLLHPFRRALALNPEDQALVEWLLALGTRFWTGDLDLVTHLLNAPDGVNLMSNASMLALGVLLAPITFAFGAPVSFAIALAANLAATAIGWYLLLARVLKLHRAAAAIGAAFCAYAPGMIAQSNAHLHMTAQWLVPVMVWGVLRLAAPGAWDRGTLRRVLGIGVLLGLVVAGQLFLGEEVLFLTAATLVLFCTGYLLVTPRPAIRAAPTLAAGLVVAIAVATAALAHPLWVQFHGPQHVPNGPFNPSFFGADLASFWTVSPLSWAGSPAAARLVSGPAEYNTFFGVPLIVAVLAATVWLWRRPGILAGMATALVMAAISLGPLVTVNDKPTPHAGPYRLLMGLPVIDGALPTRFALVAIPIIGYVLATALDRALRDDRLGVRLAVPTIIGLALLPLIPTPLPTTDRTPVPRFFTNGDWRRCVQPGGTLVPVPLANPGNPDKMRWAAAANATFAIPEGFFIGPYAAGGRASVGIYSRPTSQLLSKVELTGTVPPITADDQLTAWQDARYWHAQCFVVANQGQVNAAPLRQTMDALFGPGQKVDDVTVWRVSAG